MEAAYFDALGDGCLRCRLCPHACRLEPGHSGLCQVRQNRGGRLVLPYAGMVSALAVDPIEKKPLYHFMPGSRCFSVGYLGCNLRCPFCQNYHISQELSATASYLSPQDLVGAALNSGCPSIAHTYSEPVIHAEYLAQALPLAREAGLKNILVTNGCLNPEPAAELLAWVDAVNVDLKSWNADWYRRELGGNLHAVRSFIELAYRAGVHLEVTTLVIPERNDSPEEIDAIAAFLTSVSASIVLHLSAYRPMYRYRQPPTRADSLRSLAGVARRHLASVYLGNSG